MPRNFSQNNQFETATRKTQQKGWAFSFSFHSSWTWKSDDFIFFFFPSFFPSRSYGFLGVWPRNWQLLLNGFDFDFRLTYHGDFLFSLLYRVSPKVTLKEREKHNSTNLNFILPFMLSTDNDLWLTFFPQFWLTHDWSTPPYPVPVSLSFAACWSPWSLRAWRVTSPSSRRPPNPATRLASARSSGASPPSFSKSTQD